MYFLWKTCSVWYRPITIERDHFASYLRHWTKYQEKNNLNTIKDKTVYKIR